MTEVNKKKLPSIYDVDELDTEFKLTFFEYYQEEARIKILSNKIDSMGNNSCIHAFALLKLLFGYSNKIRIFNMKTDDSIYAKLELKEAVESFLENEGNTLEIISTEEPDKGLMESLAGDVKERFKAASYVIKSEYRKNLLETVKENFVITEKILKLQRDHNEFKSIIYFNDYEKINPYEETYDLLKKIAVPVYTN